MIEECEQDVSRCFKLSQGLMRACRQELEVNERLHRFGQGIEGSKGFFWVFAGQFVEGQKCLIDFGTENVASRIFGEPWWAGALSVFHVRTIEPCQLVRQVVAQLAL
jgi:hypothetical protein